MKTLKITTYWTADQADGVYQLLGELRSELWEHYGDEIVKMYETTRVEQRQHEDNVEVNHELPF